MLKTVIQIIVPWVVEFCSELIGLSVSIQYEIRENVRVCNDLSLSFRCLCRIIYGVTVNQLRGNGI